MTNSIPPVAPEPSEPDYSLAGLTGQPAREPRRWPWIAAGLAGLGAVVTWLAIPTLAERAVEQCQTAVSAKLKSPATVQWVESTTEDRGNGHFKIDGQMDAQNGFGALIRGPYSCEMHTPDDGGTWNVNALTVS